MDGRDLRDQVALRRCATDQEMTTEQRYDADGTVRACLAVVADPGVPVEMAGPCRRSDHPLKISLFWPQAWAKILGLLLPPLPSPRSVHFLSPDQQSGIHCQCLIIYGIQLLTPNNPSPRLYRMVQ